MAIPPAIVQVTVTKTTVTASQQAFGSVLGLYQIDVLLQSTRFKLYSTLQELLDAGFVNTDPAYLWASVIVSQDPRPPNFSLGRWIPGTKKVSTVTITSADIGVWSFVATLGALTKTYSFVAGGLDTDITIAAGLWQQVTDDPERFVDVSAGPPVVANFDTIDRVSGSVSHVLSAFVAGGAGAGNVAVTTPGVAPETVTTALDAIFTENPDDWFLYNIESRIDDDIEQAAAFAATKRFNKLFVGQTADPDIFADVSPNLGTVLNGLSYKNTYLAVTKLSTNFVDAGVASVGSTFQLDSANGVGTWAYKSYIGVTPDVLTSSEKANVESNFGNIFVNEGGRNISRPGKTTEGEFADVETTLAWTSARSKEAIFAVIVDQPTKLPFTNAGIATVQGALLGVLKTGVVNGHFTGDDPTLPKVVTPRSSDVSVSDKDNRILRNVVGTAKLSGAIHTVLAQVNVEV